MPFIFKHIAVMPDVPRKVPPLVGDPDQRGDYSGGGGRGYWLWNQNALRTALTAEDLPENLAELRQAI
ncbi:hypothetical protein ACLK1S_21210 [Escherichia coli]